MTWSSRDSDRFATGRSGSGVKGNFEGRKGSEGGGFGWSGSAAERVLSCLMSTDERGPERGKGQR